MIAPELLPAPAPVAIPPRPADGHKGTFGRVGVIAGSPSCTGAAYMAASAALRAGAGQVRLLVPRSLHPILAVKCTEIEVLPVPEGSPGALGLASRAEISRALDEWATVLVVGPGIGRDHDTARLVHALSVDPRPMVLDADGLNALCDDPAALNRLGEGGRGRVLTPHPGEMSRLLGRPVAEVQADREALAAASAQRWGAVVALKGAHTVVAAPDGRRAVDPHAVPALATGGTGDVLAGLVGGLLAQGSDPFGAAVTGVYVHAAAGRFAAGPLRSGLVATELLPAIPRIMQALRDAGR